MVTSSMVTIVRRGILRGLLTLRREGEWMTALGALFGVLLLVQLLGVMMLGLQGIQSMLRHKTDLRLELHAEASDADIQKFYGALSAEPFVDQLTLITKEKAYEHMRTQDPELIAFLEQFKLENPFADTIGVTLKNLEDYRLFSAFVGKEEWRMTVNPTFLTDVTDQEKQMYALLRVTQTGRALMGVILVVTGTALVFIVTELTRRRALARSDEVLVERLVGATPMSILLPFATEATVLCAISVVLSAAVLSVLLLAIPLLVPGLSSGGVLTDLRAEVTPLLHSLLPIIIAVEILVSPLIAGTGAWLGIRPQVVSPRIAYAV
ncbi:hypothetical protein FJZ28_00030 [Candidatus Peregrinibacteria bacterium]|nr:hypothetical protein [Candidatus Peregrinibacteria bacterium]